MNSKPLRSLSDQQVTMLEACRGLLERLSPEGYVRAKPPVFPSSIGAHMRHILDHVTAICCGAESRRIDYTSRERGTHVEFDRLAACDAVDRANHELQTLTLAPERWEVKTEGFSEHGASWAPSSTERELDFLLSHTVHHMAIMASLAQMLGADVDPAFGVAPSTLRYRKRTSACAR